MSASFGVRYLICWLRRASLIAILGLSWCASYLSKNGWWLTQTFGVINMLWLVYHLFLRDNFNNIPVWPLSAAISQALHSVADSQRCRHEDCKSGHSSVIIVSWLVVAAVMLSSLWIQGRERTKRDGLTESASVVVQEPRFESRSNEGAAREVSAGQGPTCAQAVPDNEINMTASPSPRSQDQHLQIATQGRDASSVALSSRSNIVTPGETATGQDQAGDQSRSAETNGRNEERYSDLIHQLVQNHDQLVQNHDLLRQEVATFRHEVSEIRSSQRSNDDSMAQECALQSARKRKGRSNNRKTNGLPFQPSVKRARTSRPLAEGRVKLEKTSHEVDCPLCHATLSFPAPLTLPFYKTLKAPTCKHILREHCQSAHDMLWEVAKRDDFISDEEFSRHPDVLGAALVLVDTFLKVAIFPNASGRDGLIVLLTRWKAAIEAKSMMTLRSVLKPMNRYKKLARKKETQRRKAWVAKSVDVVSQIEDKLMVDKRDEVPLLENWCEAAVEEIPFRYREAVRNLLSQRMRAIVNHTP